MTTNHHCKQSSSPELSLMHRLVIADDSSDFPGSLLISIDLLYRFDFSWVHSHQPGQTYFSLELFWVTVTYTDLFFYKVKRRLDHINISIFQLLVLCARVTRNTRIPPQSRKFISCSINHDIPDGDVYTEEKLQVLLIPHLAASVQNRKVPSGLLTLYIAELHLRMVYCYQE